MCELIILVSILSETKFYVVVGENNGRCTKANCKRSVQYKIFIIHPLFMS